jgi:rhodanese-related sulfurtransferase
MNLMKALFSGGASSISTADAKTRVDQEKNLYILDVRQPDEFAAGHIAGAKLIPLNELNSRINELPKEKPILCVCRSGSRSGMATSQLSRAGYDVVNLKGGMIGWQMAGYPVKRGR